jgi:hypothetical protein
MGTVSPIAINFTQFLTDLKGNIVKDPQTNQNVTLGDCVTNALLQAEATEARQGASAGYEEKAKRFKLAQKITNATDAITLELHEKDLIRSQTTKIYGPLIVGRVSEAINGQV